MRNKKKELKPIDVENVTNRFLFFTTTCMLPLAVLNVFIWANHWLSGIIFGWCMCSICVSIIQATVGQHNFNYMMDKYMKAMEDAVERGMKDAKKKRNEGTTGNNKEA